MAETIAIQLAAPAIKNVVGFGLQQPYSYINSKFESSKKLEYRHKRLYQDLQRLLAEKEDMEREVQKHKQKDTTGAYCLWINRVSKTESEVRVLLNKYEEERLPKWRIQKRSRLSENMETMLEEIAELLEKERPKDFLVDKPPDSVIKELDVPQIMGYPTLQNALEEILAFLRSSQKRAIGVWGKKGVGKTTIIRNLNNSEEVAELFDIVILIRCSADQTDHEFQRRIAKRLLVDIDAIEDPNEIARRMHKELENLKYLLILDEVVDEINLNELGIPKNNKGSKVVITTQFPLVYKLNRAERAIEVKNLTSDEAWKMFRDIIYPVNSVIDYPEIKPIARLVCDRCSCLPLLIHKIASSFKLKETERSWQKGLKDLKPWPELQNQGLKELYSFLTFCFEELKDEMERKCFLYTSLYPADSKVYTDYLVECWAAQGFLGVVKEKTRYQDARDRGDEILLDLINVSLLEKGEGMMYVRMDDCTRQLALHISSNYPECSVYVQSSEDLEEITNLKTWEQARWISLIDTNRLHLSTKQECSKLLTLLLQKNSKLVTIPQTFFENMSKLLVLDLHGTRIKELSSSVAKLTNLKGLYLNGCDLTLLPSEVGSLQHLEVLDIRCNKMIFIPSHISGLTNLRCLRVSYIRSGNHCIDEDVQTDCKAISKLYNLEELVIEVESYEQWCNDAEYVLQQVASLENLTILRCCFPTSEILRNFLERSKSWRDCKQFTSFQFFVGRTSSKCPKIFKCFDNRITNYLKYCNGVQKEDLTISKLLPQTDVFELMCHKDIRNLSEFIGTSSLNRVRGFVIERCNTISTILAGYDMDGNTMNGARTENAGILPYLEQLYLDNLLHLKCVFRGPLYPGTLSKLRSLTLKNCPLLKIIFLKVAIQDFSELQKLIIQDCVEIEELIMLKEVSERQRYVLPKLETLVLDNLPKLKIICPSQKLAWPSLEQLQIHECPEMRTLPFDADNAVNLRSIKGEQGWWNNLEWTSNKVQARFQSIFVCSC